MNDISVKDIFFILGRLGKSLLIDGFPMRTGRSDSPRTLVSNFIWLCTMPGRRRHVTERRMESLVVVMLHEFGNNRFDC